MIGKISSETIAPTALFYAFHQTFPDKVQTTAETRTNLTGIAKLPLEIYETIFSALSPCSLDAARYTCRLWHAMIMTNPSILESVLDKGRRTITRGELPDDEWLRLLQTKLDVQSDMVYGHNGPDAWRIRYRQCEADFLVAPLCSHEHVHYSAPPSTIASAEFCIAGTPIACLITELQSPKLGKPRHIILYRIGSTQRPYYIGSIPLHGESCTVGLIDARNSSTWTLVLEIDGSLQYYSIGTNPGFSSDDSPFTLKMIHRPMKEKELSKPKISPLTKPRATSENLLWTQLEPLHGMQVSMHGTTARL